MLTETELLENYRDHAIVSVGELYFEYAWALELAEACGKNDLAVIGIEGFRFEGGKVIPQMDLIADYSSKTTKDWVKYRNACNQAAVKFLKTWDSKQGFLVNFTLQSRPAT